MNDTLSSILQSTIPAAFSGLLAWFLARRKYQAEASGSELSNVEKALSIYRGMVQDLGAKVRELEAYVEQLEKMIDEYKQKLKNQ